MICLHKPFGNQELLQIVKMTLTTNDKSKIECSNKRDRVKLSAMFLEKGNNERYLSANILQMSELISAGIVLALFVVFVYYRNVAATIYSRKSSFSFF